MHNRQAHFNQETIDFLCQRNNYTSHDIHQQLLEIVDAEVKKRTLRRLQASSALGLLLDEAQDRTAKAQYGVVYRVLEESGVKEVFFGMKSLKASGNAENIAAHMRDMCPEGLWPKVLALGTDGCNCMSGEYGGLQLILRRDRCPFALWCWCRGHRLNLIALHSVDSFPLFKTAYNLISETFRAVYRGREDNKGKVATFRDAVAACAAVDQFGMWRERELCEVGTTRWVSHERGAATICLTLKGIIQTLVILEKSDLVTSYRSPTSLCSIFLISELMPILGRFSKSLQQEELCYFEIPALTAHYKGKVRNLRDNPENYPTYWSSHIRINAAFEAFDPESRPEEIGGSFVREFHSQYALPYLTQLEDDLEEMLQGAPVLAAFGVYDVRCTWSQEKLETELGVLCEHYGTGKDFTAQVEDSEVIRRSPPFFSQQVISSIKHEFEGVLRELKKLSEKIKSKNFTTVTLAFVNDEFLKSAYPSTSSLLQIALIMPLSTASVERLFSLMKLIKTARRIRMSDATVDMTINVALECDYNDVSGIPHDLMEMLIAAFRSTDRKHDFSSFEEYKEAMTSIVNWRSEKSANHTQQTRSTQTD